MKKLLKRLYDETRDIPVNQLTGALRFEWSAMVKESGNGRIFLEIDNLRKPLKTRVK